MLQQFQQRHPNVTVEQTSTSGTSSNVMEKYLTLIAAGTPPDVAAVNPQFIEPLWSKGALADLTAYVKRDARTFQPEDFNEATLLRAIRDGKWHALPLQMGLWFLFYNAGSFGAAGVPRPDATWTWNRLQGAAVTVRQRDPNSLGTTMPSYELPVRGNGGDILSADEKRCVLDHRRPWRRSSGSASCARSTAPCRTRPRRAGRPPARSSIPDATPSISATLAS